MTNLDRGAFAELMFGLGETYGEAISDARMEIYFAALQDLSLEQVRAAANLHVRTLKFFPKPSELRDGVDGDVQDRAESAWLAVIRLVRTIGYYGEPAWTDEATKAAAMDLFGSWRALCENLPASGPEFLGFAKQFKAAYAAYARRDLRSPELPPSQGEASERLKLLKTALEQRGLPTGSL